MKALKYVVVLSYVRTHWLQIKSTGYILKIKSNHTVDKYKM